MLVFVLTPAAARVLPSGLNETHVVEWPFTSMVAMFFAEVNSHNLILLSDPPEARILPSAVKANDRTGRECPLKAAFCLPVLQSHTRMVASSLALTSELP